MGLFVVACQEYPSIGIMYRSEIALTATVFNWVVLYAAVVSTEGMEREISDVGVRRSIFIYILSHTIPK